MADRSIRRQLQSLLDRADLQLDGPRDFDPIVHDERLFARVLAYGSVGLGEAYEEGWWDCDRLDKLFHRVKRAKLYRSVEGRPRIWTYLKARWKSFRSRAHAFDIGEQHYDLGNDLFESMLDRRMIYTCAYWHEATSLDEAEEQKLKRVAQKLQLRPGERILDTGCGWGGAAQYLSERYAVSVVGITVSREQKRRADELCLGLPVEVRLLDYRNLDERFDHILSLGMLEHVGSAHYGDYFRVVRNCLKPGGLFVLQTIGSSEVESCRDPWLERTIFPNAELPNTTSLSRAFEDRLVLEHWENFGADYDRTLMAWHENIERSWPRLRARYGERFRRRWQYYLLSCAGAFRARAIQLWQMVFSPAGADSGRYRPTARCGPSGPRTASSCSSAHSMGAFWNSMWTSPARASWSAAPASSVNPRIPAKVARPSRYTPLENRFSGPPQIRASDPTSLCYTS